MRKLHLLLTIGGGFLGAAMTLQLFFAVKESNLLVHALYLVFIFLYGYGVFVGLRLVDRPEETKHLLIFYSLQAPWISSPLLAYRFASGFHISAGFMNFQLTGFFGIGSDWKFSFFQSAPWGLGVNLFALFMIIMVIRTRFRRTRNLTSAGATQSASVADAKSLS